jgi:hypothetical protein
MGIAELLALKDEYERELVFAQAKVSVITDIIAKTEPIVAEEEFAEEAVEATDENALFSVN